MKDSVRIQAELEEAKAKWAAEKATLLEALKVATAPSGTAKPAKKGKK